MTGLYFVKMYSEYLNIFSLPDSVFEPHYTLKIELEYKKGYDRDDDTDYFS